MQEEGKEKRERREKRGSDEGSRRRREGKKDGKREGREGRETGVSVCVGGGSYLGCDFLSLLI